MDYIFRGFWEDCRRYNMDSGEIEIGQIISELKFPVVCAGVIEKINKTIEQKNLVVSEEYYNDIIKLITSRNLHSLVNKKKLKELGKKSLERVTDESLRSGFPELSMHDLGEINARLKKYTGTTINVTDEIYHKLNKIFMKSSSSALYTRDIEFIRQLKIILNSLVENIDTIFDPVNAYKEPIMSAEELYNFFPIPNMRKSYDFYKKIILSECDKIVTKYFENYLEYVLIDLRKYSISIFRGDNSYYLFCYNLMQEYAPSINLTMLKPNLSIQENDIYINLDEYWNRLHVKARLELYIYLTLILSYSFLPLIQNNLTSFLILPGEPCKYQPKFRHILRKISERFLLSQKNADQLIKSWISNPFMIIKAIECSIGQILHTNQFLWGLNSSKFNLLDVTIINHTESLDNLYTPLIGLYLNQTSSLLAPLKICYLEPISPCYSTHVFICVSGYLSQEDENSNSWSKLLNFFPYSSFYSLVWEAKTKSHLIRSLFDLNKKYKNLGNLRV